MSRLPRLGRVVHARGYEHLSPTANRSPSCARSGEQRSCRRLDATDPSERPRGVEAKFVAIVTSLRRVRAARPNSASVAPSPYMRATSKCVTRASTAAAMRFRRWRAEERAHDAGVAETDRGGWVTRSESSRRAEGFAAGTAGPNVAMPAGELTPQGGPAPGWRSSHTSRSRERRSHPGSPARSAQRKLPP